MRIFRFAGPLAIVLDHDVGDGQCASRLFDETEIRSEPRAPTVDRMDHLRKRKNQYLHRYGRFVFLTAFYWTGSDDIKSRVRGFLFIGIHFDSYEI